VNQGRLNAGQGTAVSRPPTGSGFGDLEVAAP
jgi:hypothetical protein